MEQLTTDRIYTDYKEHVSGRKYWLSFLIVSPVFLLIGAAGGNIGAGIFMAIAMLIYMIASTISTNATLRKLKNDNYLVYLDVITDKRITRNYKRTSTRWYVSSEKLYPHGKKVIPSLYNSVEINRPFAAIYSGHKLIKFYDLEANSLDSEVQSKVKYNDRKSPQ